MTRPTVMNPFRKGDAAGREYWAAHSAWLAMPFAERRDVAAPIAPQNPYHEPTGKKGAALANSGWRQWQDGFRLACGRGRS